MSFFDFLFGTTKKRKINFDGQYKLNRQDVIALVWSIKSLDNQQKELVKNELLKQLDDGGVSQWEYKEIIRQLSSQRVKLGLSEVDLKKLKNVL
jgi:hypothetical protein